MNYNSQFDDLSIDQTNIHSIRLAETIYVDKTRYIQQILKKEQSFKILIRPHRFGKTLFLNTIKDVLLGEQHLFKNTYIEQNYDWTKKYIVIKLEFVYSQSLNSFYVKIDHIAEKYNINLPPDTRINRTDPLYFSHIIERMNQFKKIDNIALLVDEYDLPLLMAGSDLMDYYVQFLRSLKPLLQDCYLKYVIMTGCTSINNLMVDNEDNTTQIRLMREIGINDISLQAEYNAVCGFTKSEIKQYYKHHINNIMNIFKCTEKEVFDEIQYWYDGYMFSTSTTEPAVYNPMSILQYFESKKFEGQNFWAVKNDHPRLAVKRLLEVAIDEGRNLLDLEKEFTYNELCEDIILSSNQSKNASMLYLQKASLESLLFQAGYLTIIPDNLSNNKYTLRIPNTEVQKEFHQIIVEAMKSNQLCVNYGKQITKNFVNLNFQKLIEVYNNFIRDRYKLRVWTSAKDKEGKCQLMFGNVLSLSNEFKLVTLEAETVKRDNKERGYIDIFVQSQNYNAIIDCKYDDTDMESCMEQVENYNLPPMKTDMVVPIVRMCINFIEGQIERIVARKYNAADKFIEEIPECVVRKDSNLFPHKCDFPGCKASFKTPTSLNSHIGHHKRAKSLLLQPNE